MRGLALTVWSLPRASSGRTGLELRISHCSGWRTILDSLLDYRLHDLPPTLLSFAPRHSARIILVSGLDSRTTIVTEKTESSGRSPRHVSAGAKIPIVLFEFSPPLDVVNRSPLQTEEGPKLVKGKRRARTQDNETSWVDWNKLEQHQEIYQFARGMIAFRSAHPVLSKEQFYTDAEIRWFGPKGGLPNWTDPKEKQFACLIHEDEQSALCLMFNANADSVSFGLPPVPPGAQWHLPLTLLAKRRMICLLRAENRLGKMYRLTT